MEHIYEDDFGKFSGSFLENGQTIQFFVSQEKVSTNTCVLPIRRFVVEGQHPQRGPFALVVNQNVLCDWDCNNYPEFVTDDFIESVGAQIEHYTAR